MYLQKILTWFYNNYNNYVIEMKNSDHNYDNNKLNPYHLEGDVWTHTLMVLHEAGKLTNDINVLFAALLHDIGKPKSKEIVNEKCRFFNHENISSFLSIDILNHYRNDFPEDNINVLETLLLINWHSDFHDIALDENGELLEKNKNFLNDRYFDYNFYMKMINLNEADNRGRISLDFNLEKTNKKFEALRNYIPIKKEKIISKNKKILLLNCGLPASGKSTKIKELNINNDYLVFGTDILIEQKYPKLTYNEAYKKVKELDEFGLLEDEMFKGITLALKNEKNLIIDRTSLSKKSRRKILNLAKDKIYNKKLIVFIVGRKKLKENSNKRYFETKKMISEKTLDSMIMNYNYPGYDENLTEIEYILLK